MDKVTGKKAIHMVSVLSSKYGLVLGQQKCYEKSNKITAIPQLLDMFFIEGSVITIDAMGCQKDLAAKIMRKKSDLSMTKSIKIKRNQVSCSLSNHHSLMKRRR